jgi:O-antigen ligase
VNKEILMKKIEYHFLFYFPLTIVLFSPTKYVFGYVSLTELFIYLHAIIFLFYVSIRGKLVLNSYVALFVAIMLFSFVGFLINNLSDSPASFKYQVRWLNYFLVFLLTINYVKASNLKYLIKGLYLATWLVCIYGIIQTVFLQFMIKTIFWIDNFPSYILQTFRTVSTFSNPLNLCVFLAFPLGILQYRKNKSKSEKILLLLIYVTLILTASKLALLLIILSTLIYFKKYLRAIIYVFSVLGLIGLILISNKRIQEKIENQFWIIERINNVELFRGSIDQRVYVLNSSIKMIRDNPVFGIGYDNFKPVYLGGYKNIKASSEETSFTSENFILDFYLDNGLIPVLIMLIFFALIISVFFLVNNPSINQLSFPLVLFICCGLILSARAAPLLYTYFLFLATLLKLQSNNNYQSVENR